MSMQVYKGNIESQTTENDNYRKVIYTAKDLQLVLMSLLPLEEIGMETHPTIDQFIRFEEGKGKAIINGNEYNLKAGDAVIVPQGIEHNIINTSKLTKLKLYTLYSKPEHKDLEIDKTKAIADKKES
jgi:mannose-6-phosphate isomerase-like protein (cupin superfamily)